MKVTILALLVAAASGCASTAKPAQPLTLPAAPPPGPWAVMRDALVSCAQDHHLVGDLVTRVELGDDGIVLSIRSSYGDSYARCVGTAMMRTRFTAQRGNVFDVAFHVPEPAFAPPEETAVSPQPDCPENCN